MRGQVMRPWLLRLALGAPVLPLVLVSPAVLAASAAAEAKEIAKLAKKRYREGQFDVAARLYLRAYELAWRPALLFNAGRAREAQYGTTRADGDRAEAVRIYRQYVEIETDVGGREEARVRIDALLGQDGRRDEPARPPARDEGVRNAKDSGKEAPRPTDGKGAGPWHLDTKVPFHKSGTMTLGARFGPLVLEEIVLRNMPSASDVADALGDDPDDNCRPKIAVGLSNKGASEIACQIAVELRTAAGEVLMACDSKDTVDGDAHNDRTSLCLFASMKTRLWPRLTHLRVTVTARPK